MKKYLYSAALFLAGIAVKLMLEKLQGVALDRVIGRLTRK